MLILIILGALLHISNGTPAEPQQFDQQLIDHFGADSRTYSQRYYENSTWWGGPGHPIICIMGGEGAIEPSTGIFYPWVTDVIAKDLGAYVVEPEHRFYGTSLPFGPDVSFNEYIMRKFFTPQQAMADAAYFLQHVREKLGCSTPASGGDKPYCPVITIGGSYPGWLSAMMRFRYPAVVDIGYSASAPMTFYTQEVGQFEYYQLITESAEKSATGCASAVRDAINAVHDLNTIDKVVEELDICTPLPEYLQGNDEEATKLFYEELDMILMYTFANLNMANNPPKGSSLQTVCNTFLDFASAGEPIEAIKYLLHGYASSLTLTNRSMKTLQPEAFQITNYYNNLKQRSTCFDLKTQMPEGKNPTISGGDWSGCGSGRNGQSWDFQTCTFLVEKIGANGRTKMISSEECVGAKKRLVIKNPWFKEKFLSNKESYIEACSKFFKNRNKKEIFEQRKSSIFIIKPPPTCFSRKSKIGNEDNTYEVKRSIKSRRTPCPITNDAKYDICEITQSKPSIVYEEKTFPPIVSLTHYHSPYLSSKIINEEECKFAALQTREHLLLQLIHNVQDEPKYLKDFKYLILFEEQRQKGIILSQSELNNEFILEPALSDGRKKGKCKGIQSHSRKGKSSSSSKNQNEMRENCNENDDQLRIQLLSTPRKRKILRKKLLNKYHESDDSDESMKSLIEKLIILEEGFIVN